MNITLTKGNGRHQLVCERDDGSVEMANLGPTLPYHDLAHYVAESALGLARGFFGNIASGCTIGDLSDADVIRALGSESWQAEVVARGVASLATGACTPTQFDELVNSELRHLGIDPISGLDEPKAESMQRKFQSLVESYRGLNERQSLILRSEDNAHDA